MKSKIIEEQEKRDHENYGDLHDGKQMSNKDNDLLLVRGNKSTYLRP
jgi:hypothetical protein